jgi:flagellin
LEVKVMSLNQGIRNANDGISMIQVAEGGMEEIGNILGRMKELAVQASNGTYTAASLTTMDNEYQGLATEITRIATTTDFNGQSILNASSTVNIHVGDEATDQVALAFQSMVSTNLGGGAVTTEHTGVQAVTAATTGTKEITAITMAAASAPEAGETLRITVAGTDYSQVFSGTSANTTALLSAQIGAGGDATAVATVVSGADVLTITGLINNQSVAQSNLEVTSTAGTDLTLTSLTSAANANTALGSLDIGMAKADAYRADLGTLSKKLDHTVSNLMNRVESQSAALSRIKDADYAVESANLAKAQVLQQAGTAMLAQANASGQSVLSLLK